MSIWSKWHKTRIYEWKQYETKFGRWDMWNSIFSLGNILEYVLFTLFPLLKKCQWDCACTSKKTNIYLVFWLGKIWICIVFEVRKKGWIYVKLRTMHPLGETHYTRKIYEYAKNVHGNI